MRFSKNNLFKFIESNDNLDAQNQNNQSKDKLFSVCDQCLIIYDYKLNNENICK